MKNTPINQYDPPHTDNAREFLLEVFLGDDTYKHFKKLRGDIEQLTDRLTKRLIELEINEAKRNGGNK